ncbi:hypothetical protein LK518_22760, partial [Parabacteroides distasonis]|nr:hypothetical protein [Parabacteroides distasonis]
DQTCLTDSKNVKFLFAAIVVLTTSKGCPNVVTSDKFKQAPNRILENETGFFSITFAAAVLVVDGIAIMTSGFS